MKQKISVIVITVLVISFIVFSFSEGPTLDKKQILQTIQLDATYNETDKKIIIMYSDKSQKTQSVVLEVLGMEKSYQKKFTDSEFIAEIQLSSPPQYGWKTTPVTLVIMHDDFGKIGLKTEIYSEDQEKPRIIVSEF